MFSGILMAVADIRSEFIMTDLIPVFFGIVLSFIIFRFWVPFALRKVQIAFYTDDGIYEVHRITKLSNNQENYLEKMAQFSVLCNTEWR